MAKRDSSGGSHWTVKALYGACGLVALAHAVLVLFTDAYSHAHFVFEGWPLFPALFGFAAFALLVLGAKLLRRFVKRGESYYGDDLTVDDPLPPTPGAGSGASPPEGSADA